MEFRVVNFDTGTPTAIPNRVDIAVGTVSVTDPTYNASGSTTSTTGTISAGSNILVLASPIDFSNGQGIRIMHAGTASAAGAPSNLTVTPQGTTGATTYNYTIAPLDGLGGFGPAIAVTTINNGNATLNTTNFNNLSWITGFNNQGYAVYSNNALVGIANGTSFSDFGYGVGSVVGELFAPAYIPTAPPASGSADWLVTTIVSGGGTTNIKLAATASTTATAQSVFHDDTAAVQAAINAATGHVTLPSGTYQISSPLTISASDIMIQGRGQGTNLQKVTATGDLFTMTGNFVSFLDFIVNTDTYQVSGALFDWSSGGSNNYIHNVFTQGGFNVVSFPSGGAQNRISDFVFNNFRNNGIWWNSGFGGLDLVSNGQIGADPLLNTGSGLFVQSGSALNLQNLNIEGQFSPILIQPAAGQSVLDVFASNVSADGVVNVARVTGSHGWTLDGSGAGSTLSRVELVNCWAGTNVQNGFEIFNANKVHCVQCVSLSNSGHGFSVFQSTFVRLQGITASNNSRLSSNTNDGVNISTNSTHVAVHGGHCEQTGTGTSNVQRWGINAADASCDFISLVGNDTSLNVTGGITTTGITHLVNVGNF